MQELPVMVASSLGKFGSAEELSDDDAPLERFQTPSCWSLLDDGELPGVLRDDC